MNSSACRQLRSTVGRDLRRRWAAFLLGYGLFFIALLIGFPRSAMARPIDEQILALIWDAASSQYRPEHRSYQPAMPREYSNGAVVETRWSLTRGGRVLISSSSDLQFPDGAVISKQFSYRIASEGDSEGACVKRSVIMTPTELAGVQPISPTCAVELRILIKDNGSWQAHVFEWSGVGGWHSARGGRVVKVNLAGYDDAGKNSIDYSIPSLGECASCHRGRRHSATFGPIGLTASRLSQESLNQIVKETSDPAFLKRRFNHGSGESTEQEAARAYLDANCGFCHNPNGLAASSALMLDQQETNPIRLGICKRPVVFQMPREWGRFDIEPGHPERSLLVRRMISLAPGLAMPELGRSLVDARGVVIVSDWVGKMSGSCEGDASVESPDE